MVIQTRLLKSIHYFSELDSSELNSIKKFFSEKTVEKGEIFEFEHDRSDVLYFLVLGIVKVFKTSYHGKEQILSIAYPGEALNDVSTFDDGPNYASGLAMTRLLLYSVSKKDMKEIVRKYPEIALKAIYGVSIRARQAWALVEDLSFSQVTGRLAKMLLKQEESKDLLPRITQQDMAAMIGTSRVVVNRSLRIMEEEGAIRLSRHGILINNKEILQRIAKSL